jgi:hypothetical protein
MALTWHALLIAAGIGQLAIVVASLGIPRALGWRQELSKVRPLTRQIFWNYAAYILATNLAFGLLSTFAPEWLLERAPLAGAVCAFIATYWTARVLVQFLYFDRSDLPKGLRFTLAEVAFVGLFVFLALVYAALTARALGAFGA